MKEDVNKLTNAIITGNMESAKDLFGSIISSNNRIG